MKRNPLPTCGNSLLCVLVETRSYAAEGATFFQTKNCLTRTISIIDPTWELLATIANTVEQESNMFIKLMTSNCLEILGIHSRACINICEN